MKYGGHLEKCAGQNLKIQRNEGGVCVSWKTLTVILISKCSLSYHDLRIFLKGELLLRTILMVDQTDDYNKHFVQLDLNLQ